MATPLPPTTDLKDPVASGTRMASMSSDEEASNSENQHTSDNADTHQQPELQSVQSRAASEFEYPPPARAYTIIAAIYFSVFIVALDRTIIGTAIPKMTDEFHSFGDIGWYQSSFMLTMAGFQLFFGRIYTFYSPKWTFVLAISLFEVGSAICGTAPTSTSFIIGRAIAGVGSAGMFNGSMVLLMNVLPLEKRPLAMGLIGGVFGIASVMGPLVGGAFTTYVTWRWCFYINLPFGGVAIAIILLVLRVDPPMAAKATSLREKILQLDPLGTACFLGSLVALLIALQWGGSTYAWSDGRIIALLIVFCVFFISFILLQIFREENRVTVPIRVILNRSIAGGMWYTFFAGSTMILVILYMPVWFQAIEGVNAEESSIRSIPLVLALVVMVISSGIFVTKVGYYTPLLYIGAIITPIGVGMLTTLNLSSNHSQWIGYQVLFGIGLGIGLQQANLAAQTCLPRKDTSIGIALLFLCQSLGGSIFASVAQNLLNSKLIKNIAAANLPIDPAEVVSAGATNLRGLVSVEDLPKLLMAYNDAITKGALMVGVGTASVLCIGAAMMEWRSTKKGKGKPEAGKDPNAIPGVPEESENEAKMSVETSKRNAAV